MAKIPDKQYNRFDGGVRRDKSPYDLKDNELQRGRNFIVDEQGRIRKRRGSRQFGQNLVAGQQIVNFHHDANGLFVATDDASPGIVYKLVSTTLNGAVTAGQTTNIAINSAGFTASGVV